MSIELGPGELIVKEGPANHFKGPESVGGKLFLTTTRLAFKSHALNVQTHEESYRLDSIVSVRGVNTLGLVPNGILVTMADGREEKFVVWGRAEWMAQIMSERS